VPVVSNGGNRLHRRCTPRCGVTVVRRAVRVHHDRRRARERK